MKNANMIERTYYRGGPVYTNPRGGRETNLGLLDQNIFFARWADEEIPAINGSVCRLRSSPIMEGMGSCYGLEGAFLCIDLRADKKKKKGCCRLSVDRIQRLWSRFCCESCASERELRKPMKRMQGWLIIIVDHWSVIFSSHWSYQERTMIPHLVSFKSRG